MKKSLILILLTLTFFTVTKEVWAKTLPQSLKSAGKQTVSTKVTSAAIGISPRLRADRKAVTVYFSNLQNVTAVSYMLRYKQASSFGSITNGQEEGAMGGLNLTGSSTDTAELLFGTCSKNVCRYHTNIKDAKLEVSYTLKSGKKYLKRYKIKV